MLLRVSVRRHIFQSSLRQTKIPRTPFPPRFSASTAGQPARKDGEATRVVQGALIRAVCHGPPGPRSRGCPRAAGAANLAQTRSVISRMVKRFLSAVPTGRGPHLAELRRRERRLQTPLRAKINEASGVSPLDVESSKA